MPFIERDRNMQHKRLTCRGQVEAGDIMTVNGMVVHGSYLGNLATPVAHVQNRSDSLVPVRLWGMG